MDTSSGKQGINFWSVKAPGGGGVAFPQPGSRTRLFLQDLLSKESNIDKKNLQYIISLQHQLAELLTISDAAYLFYMLLLLRLRFHCNQIEMQIKIQEDIDISKVT